MSRRSELLPAKRYILAAEEAAKLPLTLVRFNHMALDGHRDAELGARLARVGAPAVRAVLGDHHADERELIPDFVTSGALLAFRALDAVVDPASRRYGVRNFRLGGHREPVALPTIAPDSIQPRRLYWLGENRDDFSLAARIGLASAVVSEHSTERDIIKAVRRAQSQELNNFAYAALTDAVASAEGILEANGAQLATSNATSPVAYRIMASPINGEDQSTEYIVPVYI